MSKRILLVTEFSQLPTGYGVYSRELLSRLQAFGYEVAELACYVSEDDERIKEVPWKVYPNRPLENSPEYAYYKASPSFELGEFSFNSVLLDFQPTHSCDFRDVWSLDYQDKSPFRKFFNWIISPTNDASPLNPDWIETYGEADAVLTYCEFGRDVMLEQGNVNFRGIATPGASHEFYRHDDTRKKISREKYGIEPESYIMGTVMRNQPRKLFPDLLKTFSQYLKQSGRKDCFLYCHTAFPDLGWNIPELLMTHELSNRVYFTYKCRNCGDVTVKLFNDTLTHCTNCHQFGCNIAGVGNGLTTKELAEIYNLFDFYVQYSTNEGLGIPLLEAATCGLPITCVNYSSMESFVKNIGAVPINVLHLNKESETGRNKAVPNNEHFLTIMYDFFSLSRSELKQMGEDFAIRAKAHYNWDKCAQVWIDAIESLPSKSYSSTWGSQPIALDPAPLIEGPMTPSDQATFLIKEVLREPQFMYKAIWRRLVKDLTYRTTLPNSSVLYFHEDYSKDSLKHRSFSFKEAYESVANIRQHYNTWEHNRAIMLNRQADLSGRQNYV